MFILLINYKYTILYFSYMNFDFIIINYYLVVYKFNINLYVIL